MSDKLNTRFGKRRPWIAVFVPLSVILFFSFSFFTSRNILNIYILMTMLILVQITMSGAVGPYSGLLPDLVPSNKQGIASAIQSLGLAFGTLLGAVGTGLFMQFLPDDSKYFVSYSYACLGLLLSSCYTLFGAKEPRFYQYVSTETISFKKRCSNFLKFFYFPCSTYFNFYLIAISTLLIFVAINLILPFIQYFLKDILKFDQAVLYSSVILVAIIASAGVGTIFGGILCDKFGPKPLLVFGIGSVLTGLSFFGFVLCLPNISGVVGFLLMFAFPLVGLGLGVSMSSTTVITLKSLPKETVARDFSIINQFVNVGQILGSFVGGQVINLFKVYSIRFAYTILVAISCTLFATVLILICLIQVNPKAEMELLKEET
jgi:Na+/melibiose symporter-like transporter